MNISEIKLKGWIDLTLLRFGGGHWTVMLTVRRRVSYVSRNGKCYQFSAGGHSTFLRRRGVSRPEFERWVGFVRRTSGPIPGLD